MESMRKVLLYGFGRMGITHFAILNGLAKDLHFTVIEPNKKLTAILKRNFASIHFLQDDRNLEEETFDLTLITAPPFAHQELLLKAQKRGDKRVFIEKPFGGGANHQSDNLAPNVLIGYVLRFNPCIRWVKENVSPKDIVRAKGQYLSHTLDKKPKGWRNGEYSGVLNEMGSHIIDLLNHLVGLDGYEILEASKQSVVSDVDDVVDAVLKVGEKEVKLHLNWVNKEVRKPVFGLEFELANGQHIFVDQQIIRISSGGEVVQQISVTDLAATVPFYLRGVDFTKQMEDFLGDTTTMCRMSEALLVNAIINDILQS